MGTVESSSSTAKVSRNLWAWPFATLASVNNFDSRLRQLPTSLRPVQARILNRSQTHFHASWVSRSDMTHSLEKASLDGTSAGIAILMHQT